MLQSGFCSDVPGPDSPDVRMLGKDGDQILVFSLAGHGQRVDVCIDILSVLRVVRMEILVKDLDFHPFKRIPDVFQRLVPVDKLDFKPLVGIHVHDLLHHLQHAHDQQAGHQCHGGESGANGQTQAGSAPQGCRGGQAGDPAVGDDDRPGAQETDARYNLRCQTAYADIDMR